jgi:putative MATE family efflux protein
MSTTSAPGEAKAAARGSFLADARDAVTGTAHDYTELPLGRAVTLLAIPMVLEMAMESVFGIVDVFFVASLGPDAVAAVGVTESILTILYAVAMGLGMATTATVARRIGERAPDAAAAAAAQAVIVGLVVSLLTGAGGAALAPRLLRFMGAPAAVVEEGWGYAAWMLGGNATIVLLFLINAIFRGAGDAAIAMRALWLANLVNIVLDPCLIFGLGPFPELGVTGAAIATNVGRGLGVAYQLAVLLRGNGRVTVRPRHLRPDPRAMLRLLRLSLGGIGQMLVATASWLGLVRILTPFGSAALAGYTIALRIIIVTILPSWGMSNAAATLVGQNLGAGKPERAERSVWLTGLYNAIFLAGVALVFIAFAERLIGFFSAEPEVVAVGAECLRLISYGYVFYGYGMVMVQAFNGAGDTATPTGINLVCYWLVQIPLAWGLARGADLGPRGVFLAITLAESLIAVVGMVVFRRGAWKTRVV